ncbi:MAG: tRNA 2-thiouridine(34) synthase MnmA [bacterium]
MPKRVVIAMSGGVDSSVSAALLQKAGFEVVGVFMKFWSENSKDDSGNRCCSSESESRARQVAATLGIPFYVFNFAEEFKEKIVDYFLKEYEGGRTPNPCVVCNKEIKFGLLLEKSLAMDADFIATGHYVKTKITKTGRVKILKAADSQKDQSYFLWQLSQEQLKHVLFPVGDYTKTKVRNLAKKFKLPFYGVSESQEVCFIQTTLVDFLSRHLKTEPGQILQNGKEIGRHKGLPFYTIGQRKGIGLSGGPFYVVEKDFKKNALIVSSSTDDKKLYSQGLIAENLNWIAGEMPKLPLRMMAQVRYRHRATSAAITKKGKKVKVVFAKPQRAITSGQSVVFYKGKELLGGGIIC